ncbi:ABC transporter ATP-binding protein [Candidatus Bathyarchaeota archaeon]|nr:MAG: ABC transporter ATP-binding protein [Candidatus Bathyarchaeota archaeon]
MPSVRLVNVTKRYGEITAVEGINLEVEDGEYLCIIGPSGCGKTTLIKCISGIIEPTEGEIYIDGELMNGVPIQERGVGYVFQEIALFPHMDVYDNVSYGPRVKGWDASRMRRLVDEMLNMMALRDRMHDYPMELSGGARQKAAVARALSSGSLLLLLDEPLGALDVKVRIALRRELRRMVKELGLTAIHVTHDQEEAMAISDRIAVMRAGRIVEVGTPQDLYLNPRRLFTANFVGEANFMVGEVAGSSGGEVEVRVNGEPIYSVRSSLLSSGDVLDGGRVVAAIRPEFVVMEGTDGMNSGFGGLTDGCGASWGGRVRSEAFLGSMVRYEVEADNGVLVAVKLPSLSVGSGFRVGSRVTLTFPPRHVLLYPYPPEGLERAISIE